MPRLTSIAFEPRGPNSGHRWESDLVSSRGLIAVRVAQSRAYTAIVSGPIPYLCDALLSRQKHSGWGLPVND
jgi:hypothetical protein